MVLVLQLGWNYVRKEPGGREAHALHVEYKAAWKPGQNHEL